MKSSVVSAPIISEDVLCSHSVRINLAMVVELMIGLAGLNNDGHTIGLMSIFIEMQVMLSVFDRPLHLVFPGTLPTLAGVALSSLGWLPSFIHALDQNMAYWLMGWLLV